MLDEWRLMETMLLMRRFEEGVLRLAKDGHIRGHFHLYIGQEATGAAAMASLEPRDFAASTHRNHGHVIARGADPAAAMAELLGRATGTYGGRAGTFHLGDAALGFLSTSAIVGGCISLAVGGGYACKQKRDGSVTLACFGDGALEEGVSFEALNIAALWRLPVIFLCENNNAGALSRAEGGAPSSTHAAPALAGIPKSLGIATQQVDGGDTGAVGEAMAAALARCRAGEGPVFIEAVTRRWAGSAPMFPQLTTGALDIRMATGEAEMTGPHRDWYASRDPVLRLARRLGGAGTDARRRLAALDAAACRRIEDAIAFALNSPPPAAAGALDHVFA